MTIAVFWTFVSTIVFWPLISGAKSVYFGDLSLYFIPQFANIASALASGKLLFWNHTILGGVPHVGNPQGWLLYPTVWLNAILPPWQVAGMIPVMHLPIAAAGMHLLMRRLGVSMANAMIASGTFAFSSVLLTKAQFPNMVQAIAWTPWLLAAVICCLRRPNVKSATLLVASGSLSICAGHAQITWMDALLCIALVAWKCRSWQTFKVLSVSAVGILLVTSAYILPMLEIAAWSGRDHMSLNEANRFRVPVGGILSYVTQIHAGGDPTHSPGFRWAGNSWEVSAYFGVLTPIVLWLTALPFILSKHRLRLVIVAALALCVLGWWLSTGIQGGLYPLVFRFVPGAKAFHDPARFLHYVHIGVSIAIGAVLTWLETIKGGRFITVGIGLLNVGSLLLVAPSWYPVVDSDVWQEASRFYSPLKQSVVYAQNDRRVWLQYANPKTFEGGNSAEHVRAFLTSGVPNIPGTWGVVSAGGYEPVAPKSTMSIQGWTGAETVYDIDKLRGYGVTHIVSPSGLVLPLAYRKYFTADSVTRIVNGWQVYAKDNVQLALLRNVGWEAGRGQQLKITKTVDPNGLLLSGVGQITYQPSSFRVGLFFTMVALGILAGITLHTVQSARKV